MPMHEQENPSIRGEGGAVGLTENPSALRRWMIGGTEIATIVTEFESQSTTGKKQSTKPKSLVSAMEELGNPFKEDSGDLLTLDTKDIMPAEEIESVHNIKKIGRNVNTMHLSLKEWLKEQSQ